MSPFSKTTSVILTIIAVAFLLVSATCYWYKAYIYNEDQFTSTVVEALQSEQVTNAVATKVVNTALEDFPVIQEVVGGYAESAISGLLGSSKFEPVLDTAVREFHQIIIVEEPQDIVLNISPIVNFANLLLFVSDGEAPEEVGEIAQLDSEVVLVSAEEIPSMYQITFTVVWLGPLAGFIALILLIVVIWATSDRLYAIQNIGLITALGTLFYLLLIPYLESVYLASISDQLTRAIVDTVFTLFSSDLQQILRVIGITGLALLVLGYSVRNFGAKPKAKKESS